MRGRRAVHTTEGKRPDTYSKRPGVPVDLDRRRAVAFGKGAATLIGVVSTIIATVFLLIDHGVLGSGGKGSEREVVNVAARTLAGVRQGGANSAGESPLGNLVADGHRRAMKTQLAFMQPGGIRATIESGEVTRGDLAAVLPFGSTLVKMNLTGAQIWALLGQQFQSPANRILQVSGLRFTYHLTSPNTGEIDSVDELSPEHGPRPIPNDDSRSYTVTVDSFLAGGGDGFTVLTSGTGRVASQVKDLQALIDHVSSLPNPFDAAIQQRISRLT